MFPEWQHKFESSKPITGYGGNRLIRVTAGLHYIRGNSRPYFSVTADVYRPGANDIDAGGCMHEEIAKHWPQLAPVIALHLCDDTGAPMHAEANGWFSLAGYYQTDDRYHAGNGYGALSPDACLARFAEHVRVSIDDARTLAQTWECREDWRASRRWFGEWLTTQAERYATEAREACALLDTLIARRARAASEAE